MSAVLCNKLLGFKPLRISLGAYGNSETAFKEDQQSEATCINVRNARALNNSSPARDV